MTDTWWLSADQIHMFKTTRTAPLSRITDQATSHAAAEKAQTFKAQHISLIWTCLKDHGDQIPADIARRTGLDYHAVQRRIKEAIERGLIERLPEVRYSQHVLRAK